MSISKNFKKLAVGLSITAILAISATPAFAGKDFIKKDLRAEETTVVQLVGQELSHEHLTIVVHGGNKELMMRAYKAAQKLDDEGHSVAFLLAPDRDGIDRTATIDYYTDGYTKYYSMIFDNDKNPHEETIQSIYEQSLVAFNYAKEEREKKPVTEGITIASVRPE